MRSEIERRVAEQVRLVLQALTTRAADDVRSPVMLRTVLQNAWIRTIDEHLRELKVDDPLTTDDKLVAIAITFTCDTACEFVVEIWNEIGSAVTWNEELMSRFGVRMSSWNLLQDLCEVKQSRTNVAAYTNLFEARLAYLIVELIFHGLIWLIIWLLSDEHLLD